MKRRDFITFIGVAATRSRADEVIE